MNTTEIRITNLKKYIKEQFNDSINAFAKSINKSSSQFYNLFKGDREFGQNLARSLEEKLNLPNGYLDKPEEIGIKLKMMPVRLVEFKACAGNGREAHGEEIIGMVGIPEMIAQRKRLNPDNLIAIEVKGDSMSPTYNDSDYVFVDESQREPILNNHVYLIKYNYELSVKRLEKLPTQVIMHSDNPNKITYPEKSVIDNVPFEIMGKVVYSMGE